MNRDECPFCNIKHRLIGEDNFCYVIFDKYPVSEGHALIITKRHITSFFDLTDEERNSCLYLLDQTKQLIENKYQPDGWNIGINIGESAGQTVRHYHCHLIPRYKGDMENPEGGIRHCIEGRGYY